MKEKHGSISSRIIFHIGWILIILGGMFSIGLFLLMAGEDKLDHPLVLLFFFTFIFCSIAIGLFFVVLREIVVKLSEIEENSFEITVQLSQLIKEQTNKSS